MTPFAYSITFDYGEDLRVTQTLAEMAAFLKATNFNPSYQAENDTVTAHYPDGSKRPISVEGYIDVLEVDEIEVAAYIDDLRAKSAADEARRWSDAKARGVNLGTVTGCAPLHHCDRAALIRGEIKARRYRWKEGV